MRTVYQVIDGNEVFMTVPTSITAQNTGKVYNVLHRIRVQPHEVAKCQCRASKVGCGRADYVAEFYVIVDHHTRIVPIIIAFTYAKGSMKDGTKLYLSDAARIMTATVDDRVVDDPVHQPLE